MFYALLCTNEAHTKFQKDISCTSEVCLWLPTTMRNVPYAPISDIDFSTPSTKRKELDKSQSSTFLQPAPRPNTIPVEKPSDT